MRIERAMATTFPPPLWGRDRVGGKQPTPARAITPLPNPPPQGGREHTCVRGEEK
jgi:hypothetical protein